MLLNSLRKRTVSSHSGRSKQFEQIPQLVVAVTNLALVSLACLVSLFYSLAIGYADYTLVIISIFWGLFVQFMARKKVPTRNKILLKWRLQEAAAGTIGALVTVSILAAELF